MRIDYREYSPTHIPTLVEFSRQLEITNNSNLPANATPEQVQAYIERFCDKTYKPIVVLHGGAMVGIVIFNIFITPKMCNISYYFDQAYKNKGIASQAVQECSDALFRTSEVIRQHTIVEPENQASIRVLEKCGFQKEGFMRKYHFTRGDLVDVFMYARLREDVVPQLA